jgi:hypothetical protein
MISSFKDHEPLIGRGRVNTIQAILVHQILSQRRFLAEIVRTVGPPVEELLPPGDQLAAEACLDTHVRLAKGRLPPLAELSTDWWLT